MNIINENQFENFLNNITYQTIVIFNLKYDDESVVDFRNYLKDYYLNVIKKNNGFYIEDTKAIKIALIGSGISSNTASIELYKKDYNKINCDSLKQYAKKAIINLDNELWGDNYPDRVVDFLESDEEFNTDSFCNLIKYGIALQDRKNNYLEGDKEEQTNMLWSSLFEKYLNCISYMEDVGEDNSITYQLLKLVYEEDNHYSLASKRALIGIAYIDHSLDSRNPVDKDIMDLTIRNIKASELENNSNIRLVGKELLIKLEEYKNGKSLKKKLNLKNN
jgi:hypothetical protein